MADIFSLIFCYIYPAAFLLGFLIVKYKQLVENLALREEHSVMAAATFTERRTERYAPPSGRGL